MVFGKMVSFLRRKVLRPAAVLGSIAIAFFTGRAALIAVGIVGIVPALILPGGMIALFLALRLMAGTKNRENAWDRAYAEWLRQRDAAKAEAR